MSFSDVSLAEPRSLILSWELFSVTCKEGKPDTSHGLWRDPAAHQNIVGL